MYYLQIYDGYVPLNNCSIDIIHLPLGARLECIQAFFFFFAYKKFTQIIEKISRYFLFWHVQQQSRKIANEKPNPCQIKNMSYLHRLGSVLTLDLPLNQDSKTIVKKKGLSAHFLRFLLNICHKILDFYSNHTIQYMALANV